MKRKLVGLLLGGALVGLVPQLAYAGHAWGNYHWARTSNPFNLRLGDNLSSVWDAYVQTTASDWSRSSVMDTIVVTGGTTGKRCRPTAGRVEVCNALYGKNGWLGLAQIWASGSHITQGTAKVNDTYFNTAKYNTPAWKNMVMCQEVAHTFGLDHQDEIFDNPNLGSCMDYTSNPSGPPSNEYPNQHDYDMLETIYAHVDSSTTLQANTLALPFGLAIAQAAKDQDLGDRSSWGKAIRDNGHVALFELDLGGGQKLFTFVVWAEE